jgi:NitT/TauT family transport system permease protein
MHKPVDIQSRQGDLAALAARILTSPGLAAAAFLVCCALLLEWAVASGAISPGIVARPSEALVGIFTLQRKVDFIGAIQTTASLVAFAVVLELLFAIPFGYFLYRFRVFGLAYTGWLTALFAAPIFLLYPLFMVIFGRNAVTLIVMGFLPGVIPLILHVQQGFLNASSTCRACGSTSGIASGCRGRTSSGRS